MVSKKKPRVMYFPTLDFLSPYQQKKKLIELAGEVVTYNMYHILGNLPKFEELNNMPKETATNIVRIAHDKHRNKDLQKYWGISAYALNKLFNDYGLITPRKPSVRKVKEPEDDVPTRGVEPKPIEQPQGFKVELDGVFDSETLGYRLMSLIDLTANNSEYEVNIIIIEK